MIHVGWRSAAVTGFLLDALVCKHAVMSVQQIMTKKGKVRYQKPKHLYNLMQMHEMLTH